MRLFARVGNAILQPALKLNRRLILKCGAHFDPIGAAVINGFGAVDLVAKEDKTINPNLERM
jgi:hypothetical protein